MELCVILVSTVIYLLIAVAFWADDEVEQGDDQTLHALACIVRPLVVVVALVALGADAALAVFRRRR